LLAGGRVRPVAHKGQREKCKVIDFVDRWFDFLGPPCKKNLLLRGVVVIYR